MLQEGMSMPSFMLMTDPLVRSAAELYAKPIVKAFLSPQGTYL